MASHHGTIEEDETMKDTLKKISKVLKTIFGYGIAVILFAGSLIFLGYLIALLIGGETATAICTILYKSFIPVLIKGSTCLILLGLLSMYLAGEKALIPEKRRKISATNSATEQ